MPKMLPAIGAMITVAVVLVSGLVLCGLWLVGFPEVAASERLTLTNLFDLLKLAFAVVAGIGGVVALVVAYRRQQVAEDSNRIARKKNELDHAADQRAAEEHQRGAERLYHERFQKASEQLGHEAAAVRLAGVYAMASLADDWEDHRQTCIDVLCAYLRMYFNPNPADSQMRPTTWQGEHQVRRTVVRVITTRLCNNAPACWQGCDLDFTGATFIGESFANAQFTGGTVSFRLATFHGRTNFYRTSFDGAQVYFHRARFIDGETSFTKASFHSGHVSFSRADFASSGTVDFRTPSNWTTPPIFDDDVFKDSPKGLLLPEGWRRSRVSTVESDGKG